MSSRWVEIVSYLYLFIYKGNTVAKVATTLKFLVAKLKVFSRIGDHIGRNFEPCFKVK